jgi:GNAT superfamily N-acetyltransferase
MIRRCDERDFELIWSIINDGALAYKSVIPADCWTEPYMSRDELHAEMEDGVSFWGYEENEALTGVMGIQGVEDVTLIRHAYVRTGSQKRGIGGRLLSHLHELAHGPVLIGTWADAVWAVHFYEKHGFHLVAPEQKARLLKRYWNIPDRQVETSVVLADPTWRDTRKRTDTIGGKRGLGMTLKDHNLKLTSAICVCIFMLVLGAGRLNAQATAGIVGTVTDMSGAAIAGATVQVKNVGTGATRNATTDAAGRFRAPDLVIGEYELQASNPGFQTVVHKGITLTVGSEPVVDFSLPVGQAQQTLTVEGQVSQVETQSTAVGSLVEGAQIRDLPLNGRNYTSLLTLAPGVIQIPLGAPGAGSTFYGNGQKYSIAGSRPSGQAYMLDDQNMVNFWNNGPGAGGLGTALGVEAIAEFQTLTNTFSAQFGGNGAVINASSRPGTNAFHGSGFEFLRNDKS